MTRNAESCGNRSHYATSLDKRHDYPRLTEQVEAHTVIIGGGLAGLNTALSLAEAGAQDIVLLEAVSLGFGASGRNGGFVFAGYSLGEQALLSKVGAKHARRLYQRSVGAVERIRQRIDQYSIDCELVDEGVILANWFRDPQILKARQQLLAEHFGVDWQWLPQAQLRELLETNRYFDGLFEPNALHLNPLKYLLGLAAAAAGQGVRIHEHSRIATIERDGRGWRVASADGMVRCKNLVLACGGYLSGLVHKVDRAVMPIATYAMVTEPLRERDRQCIRTRAAIYDIDLHSITTACWLMIGCYGADAFPYLIAPRKTSSACCNAILSPSIRNWQACKSPRPGPA